MLYNKLAKNFEAIDSLFSSAYDGCDLCAVNLKRFWCYFTCHPEQADFVKVGNLTWIMVDGNNKTLRELNLTINSNTNCDLFKSCKKTKYATQVSAMSNAIGFTTFQVLI